MDVVFADAPGIADLEIVLRAEVIQLVPETFNHHARRGIAIREIDSLASGRKIVREIVNGASQHQEKQKVLKQPDPALSCDIRRCFRYRLSPIWRLQRQGDQRRRYHRGSKKGI